MTNLEIITGEVIANEIMTKEEVIKTVETVGYLPFMTYQEWKYIGFQVKKGSKAIIKTKIWKKVKNSKDDEQESKFILVNASLFGPDQVEKIEQEELNHS